MAGFFDPPQGLFGYFPDEDAKFVGKSPTAPPMNRQTMGQGGPSALQNIVGYLADYLAQMGGGGPIYAPTMARKQDLADQWSMYERKRADDWTDWERQQDYERKNPKPQQPTQTDRYIQEYLDPNTPQSRKALLGEILAPGHWTTDYQGRPMQIGGANNIVGSTGDPDSTPTVEDGYQYTPGPGGRANEANWKPVGGASPSNGSGGFSGPF